MLVEWEGWGGGRTFGHGRVGSVVSVRVGRGLIVVMSRKVFSSAMSLENCDRPDSSSCLWALLVYRERQVETGGTKT